LKTFYLVKHNSSFYIIELLACFQMFCRRNQASCIDNVLVIAILQYFFDERRACPVMIGLMCSFSNCFCIETLYKATFRYILLIFIVFSAWSPDKLPFKYQHLLFIFYISAQPSVAETDHSAVMILTTIVFVIPFVFMVKIYFIMNQ